MKKRMQEKIRNKAPKKGNEEDEQPQMMRVAIESNMNMGFLMPTYSKWMTSQIQFIKDRTVRDTQTKEQIWKRIYPQENGIPCKSINGKYRVKVRFMEQERLVEIDDRMPCDSNNKLMFPRTTDFTEIWPQLLIKAFFKLYSFKWFPGATYDRETGDSSLVYALTGLIGERIKINDFHQDGLDVLRKHLSDEYYFDNKTYVMTYCGPTFKPKIPSQMPGNKPEENSGTPGIANPGLVISKLVTTQKQKLARKLREIASLALSITSGRKLTPALLNKQRQSYVIPGFGYALMDLFENKNVDMDTIVKKIEHDDPRSPFRSPNRVKKKPRRASPRVPKTMTLKKRSSKKKSRGISLKEKARTQMQNIKKAPPIQYKLIKIRTSVGNYPILNVNPPFTNSEIKLANKCRLNGWERPPPELDPNFVPEQIAAKPTKDFKLDITPIKEENEKGDKVEENKEEDEEKVEEKKPFEPRTRAPGGIWLQAGDFPFCFQYFIIFHNENKIKNKSIHRDIWTVPSTPYKVNEENIYIRIRDLNEEELKEEQEAKEEAKGEEQEIEEHDQYKNIEDYKKDDKKRVLVAFSPNPTEKEADRLPRYY